MGAGLPGGRLRASRSARVDATRRDPTHPRLVTNRTGIDHTERMERWAEDRLEELSRLDLCGYICKKDSPSCGMEPMGVFTRMFIDRFPHLPVEEEGRLADPVLCGTFLRRVKA